MRNKVRYAILLAMLALFVASFGRRVGDKSELLPLTARTIVGILANAAVMYQVRHHRAPTLVELITPDEHGRAELDELPLDPWDKPYVLRQVLPGPDFEAICSGPDGELDTADDITARSNRYRHR